MKNQYVCDIGDYGKYLLLHYIINPDVNKKSLSLGINWYLTPNDNRSDGKFIDYLDNDENNINKSLIPVSNKIYNSLKIIYKTERSIDLIQKTELLPATIYYSEIVDINNRSAWLNKSISQLSKSDIIFLDPDNGIAFNENGKDLSKYITCDDLKSILVKTKATLILYHHGSRPKGGLELYSKLKILPYIKILYPNASVRILWYHKGTARLYIFIIRKHKKLINNRIDSFIKNHKNHLFSEIKL